MRKMDNKLKNNIYESGFESFEFDEGFLSKVDAETKAKKVNNLENSEKKKNDKSIEKQYNFSINLEDFNESDFFESKSLKENQKKRNDLLNKAFIAGLSPIHGVASSKNLSNSFSSTPLRKPGEQESVLVKEEQKKFKTDFCVSDSIDFDEWNGKDCSGKNVENNHQSLITISQAVKFLEEAKSDEGAKDENDSLNKSIDLLTGEIVGDVGDLFADSFTLSKLESNKKELKNLIIEESICSSSEKSVVELDSTPMKPKPQAAQKLNFGKNDFNESFKEKEKDLVNLQNINFESDDDFGVLTQVDAKTDKKVSSAEPDQSSSPIFVRNKRSVKLNDSEFSNDNFSLRNKKETSFYSIESDSSSNSSSPTFKQRSKKHKTNKVQGRQFIDSEAEVSDEVEVSSDEPEKEGEYDKSFVDEGSYLTQNQNAEMTAKYLESVKNMAALPGGFKIPKAKPYVPEFVFSQIPEDTNTDYEMDSFCVNEVDEEIKSELSDLEVAEKILEMDRKKRKKKKVHNSKRSK